MGLYGLYGLPQTTIDIGHFPDVDRSPIISHQQIILGFTQPRSTFSAVQRESQVCELLVGTVFPPDPLLLPDGVSSQFIHGF